MTRSSGNPEFPLDPEIERTLLREWRLCKFTLRSSSSSTLDPNNPDKAYLTDLSSDDRDREMETGNQANQQTTDNNAPLKDTINNTEEVLDENGQVIGNQEHQTPVNLRNNQPAGIGRGTQERVQNPPNARGALQR